MLYSAIIHHPETIDKLIKTDCRRLLSDPAVIEIFDSVVNMYNKNFEITPESILEDIAEEASKERFREAMLLPPFFSEENISQVLEGFRNKASHIKMANVKREAIENTDLHQLNKILALKREREKHLL